MDRDREWGLGTGGGLRKGTGGRRGHGRWERTREVGEEGHRAWGKGETGRGRGRAQMVGKGGHRE